MIAFLRVISPGAFTTVQDRGRFAFRQFGVPPSGVLDRFSYTVANMLAHSNLPLSADHTKFSARQTSLSPAICLPT